MRYQVYIIQGFLGSNPNKPVWADVTKVVLDGYKKWDDHPHRLIYHGDRFWTDVLAFDHEETGLQCLTDLRTGGQPYTLRLIERIVEKTEREVLGRGELGVTLPLSVDRSARVQIDWSRVPKQALVDALRNASLGPANLSRQDKADLVRIATDALRGDKAETLRNNLITEIAFQLDKKSSRRAGSAHGDTQGNPQ